LGRQPPWTHSARFRGEAQGMFGANLEGNPLVNSRVFPFPAPIAGRGAGGAGCRRRGWRRVRRNGRRQAWWRRASDRARGPHWLTTPRGMEMACMDEPLQLFDEDFAVAEAALRVIGDGGHPREEVIERLARLHAEWGDRRFRLNFVLRGARNEFERSLL